MRMILQLFKKLALERRPPKAKTGETFLLKRFAAIKIGENQCFGDVFLRNTFLHVIETSILQAFEIVLVGEWENLNRILVESRRELAPVDVLENFLECRDVDAFFQINATGLCLFRPEDNILSKYGTRAIRMALWAATV